MDQQFWFYCWFYEVELYSLWYINFATDSLRITMWIWISIRKEGDFDYNHWAFIRAAVQTHVSGFTQH